jgi:hypothetical protein
MEELVKDKIVYPSFGFGRNIRGVARKLEKP